MPFYSIEMNRPSFCYKSIYRMIGFCSFCYHCGCSYLLIIRFGQTAILLHSSGIISLMFSTKVTRTSSVNRITHLEREVLH